MISQPKVSICIPTYKQLEYLKRSLDSIFIQTFTDYEIIITDDSPDDSVSNLLKNYNFAGKLNYFKNTPGLGSPENWNESVRKAKGQYIKILHHDDWFTNENSLKEFVKLLDNNPDADFGFSAVVIQHADTKQTRLHSINSYIIENIKNDPTTLFLGNHIGPPSATIYKNKFNLQYDSRMKWLVDMDFYIQSLNKNTKFAYTDQPLITNITAASHNVTNECFNDKKIQLFEHFHLFNKIKTDIKKGNYRFFINHLIEVLNRFNIKKVSEIREAGYTGIIPKDIQLILFMKYLPKFLFRLYYKTYINKTFIKNHPLNNFKNFSSL